MEPIILASKSPRRRELLELAGVPFSVETEDVEETFDPGLLPAEIVRHLSRIKAEAVFKKHPAKTVLGADTIVVLDGGILGKPKDEEEAVRMLQALSGKTHEVFTGVTILSGKTEYSFAERTAVTFYELSEEEIRTYVSTGEPLDKAGAYGIQGRGVTLVRSIEGDYPNVVGLPVAKVVRALRDPSFSD